MKQLTLGVILKLASELKKEGMTTKQIHDLPIYIGDDDELNGIHTAWYGQLIDSDTEKDAYFVELINEDLHNYTLNGKAILIS